MCLLESISTQNRQGTVIGFQSMMREQCLRSFEKSDPFQQDSELPNINWYLDGNTISERLGESNFFSVNLVAKYKVWSCQYSPIFAIKIISNK